VKIRSDSVITIAQAKKLLGDESLVMTDEEIQELIENLDVIAQYSIQLVHKFKYKDSDTD
jgi:hypothetical protein